MNHWQLLWIAITKVETVLFSMVITNIWGNSSCQSSRGKWYTKSKRKTKKQTQTQINKVVKFFCRITTTIIADLAEIRTIAILSSSYMPLKSIKEIRLGIRIRSLFIGRLYLSRVFDVFLSNYKFVAITFGKPFLQNPQNQDFKSIQSPKTILQQERRSTSAARHLGFQGQL